MCESDVLLAFEMGTGKTPTTLWALEELRGSEFDGPGTVVVPASLKWQWKREVERFTDQKAVVIDGTPKQRQEQYLTVRGPGVGYMILSYDTYVRDWKHHNHLARGFLVLDEATAIKGFKSKRSQHIKQYRDLYKVRFALTGTPIENGKAEEVFSIMEFVDPAVLGKFWSFETQYIRRNSLGWIEGYRNLDRFHRRISPYIMRATHHEPEVAKYLPKVMERDPILVQMDRRTAGTVQWIVDALLTDLDAIADGIVIAMDDGIDLREDHPDGKMMAKIQVMRMLLDHPQAVVESAAAFASSTGGSAFAHTLLTERLLDDILHPPVKTPKMDALEQYLKDFFDTDPSFKAVVFSSFVTPAHLISQRFPGSVVFHGGMNAKQKDAAKQKFTSDPSCRLFVSTDAGGYGLDLPVANLVCNFDMPWQAGMLAQRSARIKRASSKWEYVIVQDFLVENTIEERMREMLLHKIAISDAIVDGEGITEAGGVASDLDTLRSFLSDLEERRLIRAS
jgi:SNF2 family DNA or RNA helicase